MDKNISKKTVGILMPGDMGHGCGQAFKENGFKDLLRCAVSEVPLEALFPRF